MAETEVEALLNERAGYLATGKKDRAAQVDAILAGHGIAVEAAVSEPDTEKAVTARPAKRAPKKV